MRPPKQKQPQVKKGLCRVLEHVDVTLKRLGNIRRSAFCFFGCIQQDRRDNLAVILKYMKDLYFLTCCSNGAIKTKVIW